MVISRVTSRVTILITHIRGLITPTYNDPGSSRCYAGGVSTAQPEAAAKQNVGVSENRGP